jgi:integrase
VFQWAEKQGHLAEGSNPVRGLSPSKRQAKKQASQRRPFTDEELLTVLGSPEFVKQRDRHPERFWLTLICLFQVCRREEAGQCTLADIGEADGIPFIRITNEGEGQNVKNDGSKRRLPIHSSLIALGFMEYVARTRQTGTTRLFPQLKRGRNGYADPVGKWFSRLVTKAGITDPNVVLHSLRHGGIKKLHAAGVPQNIVEVLAGHASQNVHGQVYVHREGLPLNLLREGLEKLRYVEVEKALGEVSA